MRLATKGLLLLILPTVAQLCTLGGFLLLQLEISFYPRRAAQDIEHINGLTRFFLDDFAAVMDLQNAYVRKEPLGESSDAHMKMLLDEEAHMKNFSTHFVDARRKLLVVPDEAEIRKETHDHGGQISMYDMVAASTQAAYNSVKQLDQKSDPVSLQSAGASLHTALVHLENISRSNFTNGTNPEKSLRERRGYYGYILALSLIILIGIVTVFYVFSRRIARRLTRLLRNVDRFKSGEDITGVVSGTDEIAQINKTFRELFKNLRETMFPHQAMMEHSQDLICLLDSHGRIISTSTSCIKLLAYSPDELSNIWLIDLVTNDMQAVTSEKLKQVALGEVVAPFESTFIREDKTIVDVLISVTWSQRDQFIFCVAHDITQRKAAERLQQDVMHMVSHDLKTPLNAISNFHEMLETGMYGELPSKNLEQVQRAQRSTERMLTLIRDLLDIEKMKSGMLELELNQVKLDDVIEQARESVENLAEKESINIVTPKSNLEVTGDQSRLIQILVNLLSNSIKFSPKSSTINVYATRDASFTNIFVADQGRGIPSEAIKTIFDRFSQTRGSDATVHGGSGLGLSICKALAELHGGDIDVRSEVGKGTTFRVRIPVNFRPDLN